MKHQAHDRSVSYDVDNLIKHGYVPLVDLLRRRWSASPAATVGTLVAILASVVWCCVVFRRRRRFKDSWSSSAEMAAHSEGRDADIRSKAAQAALERHASYETKKHTFKKQYLQEQQQRQLQDQQRSAPREGPNVNSSRLSQTLQCRPCNANSSSGQADSSLEGLLPLYNDGMTIVRHIPTLPRAETAAMLLNQLTAEFIPIIRSRQYNVSSISEFCCCGDGMEFEMGHGGCGLNLGSRARAGRRLAGDDSCKVAGYNQLHTAQRFRTIRFATSQDTSSIHLRLRRPPDPSSSIMATSTSNPDMSHHYAMISYNDLCANMAHELAHCVYRHHGPEFQALMRDIQSEYEWRYAWR